MDTNARTTAVRRATDLLIEPIGSVSSLEIRQTSRLIAALLLPPSPPTRPRSHSW